MLTNVVPHSQVYQEFLESLETEVIIQSAECK